MQNVTFCYYTGTGNTERALKTMSSEFIKNEWIVSWYDIGNRQEQLYFDNIDLLIVGFPAIGFSIPKKVSSFLKTLPKKNNVKAAILCCCGGSLRKEKIIPGWSGNALLNCESILRNKGFKIIGTHEASYPVNWTQFFNGCLKENTEIIALQGDKTVSSFALNIIHNNQVFVQRNVIVKYLIKVIIWFFTYAGRYFLSRTFISDLRCNGCGICQKTCPSNAITMNKKIPEWNLSCSLCNRCINICPLKSIQTSVLKMILHLGINIINFSFFIFGFYNTLLQLFIKSNTLSYSVISILLYVILTIIQFTIFDRLLSRFLRIKIIRKIFSYSFTKNYTRYLDKNFIIEKKIYKE